MSERIKQLVAEAYLDGRRAPWKFETSKYCFTLHRIGASITRKADNTSVYFQPGDSTQDAVEAVSNALTHTKAEKVFNEWCDRFSVLFDSHAIFLSAARQHIMDSI